MNTKYCIHPDYVDCAYCIFSALGTPEEDLKHLVRGAWGELGRCYSGDGCDLCGGKVQPYMVKNKVWNKAKKRGEHFLCLACIESRLGKKLTLEDFTDAPINYGMFMFDCRTYVE